MRSAQKVGKFKVLEKIKALISREKLFPLADVKTTSKLADFGKRYGMQAMVSRASSIAHNQEGNIGQSKSLVKSLSFLFGMNDLWKRSSITKPITPVEKLKLKKKQLFIKGFSKSAELKVRLILTYAFHKRIFERYLTPKEYSDWTHSLDRQKQFGLLQKLIERRSGASFTTLAKDVQLEVEQDLAENFVANLKDAKYLGKNPQLLTKYQKALSTGDIGSLSSIYSGAK